jgi:uncharacterized protein
MTDPQREQSISDPILMDIVNRLAEAYHPLRIYLFGSRARGTEESTSDYDILIVVRDDASEELKSASPAYRALWGMHAAVDVLVSTAQEFEKRLHLPNSLPAEIARDGLLLHVA